MLSRKFDVMHIERLLIMSDLYNRIEELCSNRKINITTMCRESGTSRASLTDLKMGRKQGLSAETLSKISKYFGVSVDFLLGNKQKEKPAISKDDELNKLLKNEKIRNIVMRLDGASEDTVEMIAKFIEAVHPKDD